MTGEASWLERAGVLLETRARHFTAEDGTLYDTADDAEALIRRPQDPTDSATPSGWTAAAQARCCRTPPTPAARGHREAAERALGIVRALASRAPRFIGWGLAAAEAALDGPREVAVVGPQGDPGTGTLHRAALLATAPGAVVAAGRAGLAGGAGRAAAARPAAAGRSPHGVRVPQLHLRRPHRRSRGAGAVTADH